MPVALAPTGLTGMQYPDGEILAAQAAEKFGVPFCLSTMSICSIEDVAERTTKPFWFQLYVMKDRGFIERLIELAKAAKCSALVLTLDLQILGQRHKDIKNGLSAPPKLTIPNILNMMTKPHWCMGMLQTPRRTFRNIVGHATGVGNMSSLSSWTAEQFDPGLNWGDVEWIKKLWGGKLIIKGIMEASKQADIYQRAAGVGLYAIFGLQAAVNMSVNLSLIALAENETTKRLASYAALVAAIHGGILVKPERHEFNERPQQIVRFMSQTGG